MLTPSDPPVRRPRPSRELRKWIHDELQYYVADFIPEDDFRMLEKNLIDIAQVHAHNLKRRGKS